MKLFSHAMHSINLAAGTIASLGVVVCIVIAGASNCVVSGSPATGATLADHIPVDRRIIHESARGERIKAWPGGFG
jgi:hypothetical protein